jgi:hypothetical protein
VSGIPIIQDGNRIDAVIHVLVIIQTKGHEIFIENTLRQIGGKAE